MNLVGIQSRMTYKYPCKFDVSEVESFPTVSTNFLYSFDVYEVESSSNSPGYSLYGSDFILLRKSTVCSFSFFYIDLGIFFNTKTHTRHVRFIGV